MCTVHAMCTLFAMAHDEVHILKFYLFQQLILMVWNTREAVYCPGCCLFLYYDNHNNYYFFEANRNKLEFALV